MGTATPMPTLAPVDKPLELDCEGTGVLVAAEVGAVFREPDFAAALVVEAAAVCADKRLMIFWSFACHCTWMTSAVTVIAPLLASTDVRETPGGIGSLPASRVE